MVFSLVSLFERGLERFFHTIFSYSWNETLEKIAREFFIQFLDVLKLYGTIYIFFRFIHLPSNWQIIVDKIASILLIIIIIFFFTTLIRIIFEKWIFVNSKTKTSQPLILFVTKFISVFIWIIWLIIIIWSLGYDVSAVIAWAWIWGIAIALAAQKSLTNIFGAITIVLNKPFKVWDIVRINNFTGKVKDIGLSYLTIIDMMGHQVMIPNENIITTSIENLTDRDYRRTEFFIWLVYGTTIENMKVAADIIESILKEYEERKEILPKYRATFDNFWDFSLNIRVLYNSLINSDWRAYDKQKEKINLEIKEKLTAAGIEIAFPTQEMIIKQAESTPITTPKKSKTTRKLIAKS